MELISVIVVSYNSAQTILQTLDSIKQQTYPNIEIVVTDDGSSDDTVKVVKAWTQNNSVHCKIVESATNTGISANANRGVKNASGKYIKLIAADDLLRPQAIKVFYDYASGNNDKKIIYQSKLKTFGVKNEAIERYIEESYSKITCSCNQFDLLLKHNFLNAPAIGLFERDMVLSLGGFDERFKMLEDYPFYLKLAHNGFRFELIDEVLVDYRVGEQSVRISRYYLYYKSNFCFFWKQLFLYLMERKQYSEAFHQGTYTSLLYFKACLMKILKK